MALPDSLKKAIVNMPVKEKDKLLLRLIQKEPILVERLHYELIEEESTLVERREELSTKIKRMAAYKQDTPGWLMMDLRSLSGDITHHVKITKDKIAALEQNLLMMVHFMQNHQDMLRTYSSRSDTCALYLAKKANTILNAFNKLDEDYRFDYLSDINEMLRLLHSLCSKTYARQLDIPEGLEG
tara:strand:+ start:1038 stop:1589 length:552 start_codon:yes stop_codon:yes gene_type:complete